MEKTGKTLVEYLSGLARITLSEDEKALFIKDLDKMISYVSSLNKVNTDNISPSSHVLDITNVWREDIVEPFSSTDKILANAPDRYNKYLKVPKII